tara:strand:+ start:376 stop:885 length:510 start_codon:yes stop_codon:yes gene_type:complete
MSQLTYFIPFAFARSIQDPQSRPETPTGVSGGTGPTGVGPTGAGPTGTTGGTNGSNTGVPSPINPNDPKKPAATGPCASDEMMWMMLALPVLMYFMMIRPESKRKKEQAALLSAIRVGESVVMLSGMHGVVSALDDKTVTIRAGDANITFDRSAVSRIVRDEPAAETGK